MLKTSLKISTTIFIFLLVVGCRLKIEELQQVQSYTTPQLVTNIMSTPSQPIINTHLSPMRFNSWEELFYEYRAINEGNASRYAIDMNAIMNFSSLDVVYMPVAIPKGYELFSIDIFANLMSISFIYTESEEEMHFNENVLDFRIRRWSYDDLVSWGHETALDGIMQQFGFTEDELIDGKYYLHDTGSSSLILYWALGPKRASLIFTRPTQFINSQNANTTGSGIQNFTTTELYELLPLTQTITVNLSDTALIQSIIEAEQAGQMFTMAHYEQHMARQQTER